MPPPKQVSESFEDWCKSNLHGVEIMEVSPVATELIGDRLFVMQGKNILTLDQAHGLRLAAEIMAAFGGK